jgi:hypothetical protein
MMQMARKDGIEKLYHYQGPNLCRLEDILKNKRVYFSNPADFNDPWDCQPFFDSLNLDDATCREKWGIQLERELAKIPPQARDTLRELPGKWYDHQAVLRNVIEKMTIGHSKAAQQWRIYCLTPYAKSLLMWAHYGDKHCGVCLEFNATRQFGLAYKVTYRDELLPVGPDIREDHKALAELTVLTKSKEWEYEREYRMLSREKALDPTFALTTEDNYFPLPPVSLTAIIMGWAADKEKIRDMVRKFWPGLNLKRAVKRPHEYHIDIVDDDGISK